MHIATCMQVGDTIESCKQQDNGDLCHIADFSQVQNMTEWCWKMGLEVGEEEEEKVCSQFSF